MNIYSNVNLLIGDKLKKVDVVETHIYCNVYPSFKEAGYGLIEPLSSVRFF